jgi:hypothetical protein
LDIRYGHPAMEKLGCDLLVRGGKNAPDTASFQEGALYLAGIGGEVFRLLACWSSLVWPVAIRNLYGSVRRWLTYSSLE